MELLIVFIVNSFIFVKKHDMNAIGIIGNPHELLHTLHSVQQVVKPLCLVFFNETGFIPMSIPGCKNIKITHSLPELFSLVDGLVINENNNQTLDFAIQALKLGLPVCIYSPWAFTVENLMLLLKIAEEAGTYLSFGVSENHNPEYNIVSQQIANVQFVEIRREMLPSKTKECKNLFMIDLFNDIKMAIHFLDCTIKKIRVFGNDFLLNNYGFLHVHLEFSGGLIASIVYVAGNRKSQHQSSIYTHSSIIDIDYTLKQMNVQLYNHEKRQFPFPEGNAKTNAIIQFLNRSNSLTGNMKENLNIIAALDNVNHVFMKIYDPILYS